MQTGEIHRHIDFEAQWQAYLVLACDSFDLLHVFDTIDHQRNTRARRCCLRHGSDILLVPGRIPDQQLVEALRAAGHEASVVMIPDERHLLSRVESRRRWLTLAVDHLRDASNEPTADVGRPGVPPGQAAS